MAVSVDFEDRIYDVAVAVSLAAGSYLASQAQDLRNADAEWFFTGADWYATSGAGVPAIRLQDAFQRAVSTNPEMISQFASRYQQAPAGSLNYLRWPRNMVLKFDLQELSGTGACTGWLLLRGFKRFRKGEAPCR